MSTTSRPSQNLIRPDKDTFLNEENPFEAMMSRFDYAAQRLSLDPGLYKVLRSPEKQIIVSVPILRDNGEVEVYTGYRVLYNTVARARQGRHPVRPERDARRGEGAGGVDDLEVRRREHPVRRLQGRGDLRPRQPSPTPSSSASPAATPPPSSTPWAPTPTCPRRT